MNRKSTTLTDIAARRKFGAKVNDVFRLMSDEQVLAVLSVLQDVIDGRTEIFCKSVDLTLEQTHFVRGGIAALYDLSEQIVAARRGNKPSADEIA